MIDTTIRRLSVFLVLLWTVTGSASAAWTDTASERPTPSGLSDKATSPAEGWFLMAQGGCSAAASQAAAQTGGQVLSVQTAQRGGRTVCIVTVLIPGRGGDRPRRQTITIPQ